MFPFTTVLVMGVPVGWISPFLTSIAPAQQSTTPSGDLGCCCPRWPQYDGPSRLFGPAGCNFECRLVLRKSKPEIEPHKSLWEEGGEGGLRPFSRLSGGPPRGQMVRRIAGAV